MALPTVIHRVFNLPLAGIFVSLFKKNPEPFDPFDKLISTGYARLSSGIALPACVSNRNFVQLLRIGSLRKNYHFNVNSPRHQREYTPAQVFTRVSGVALGFRGQLGSNIFR